MAERILERDSVQMYESDYSKYAVVVDRRRMIADTRDGLIPVQRRILYTALSRGLINPAHNDKSAQVIGITAGTYHPHGMDAVYGAVATMAIWFKTKYPLCAGIGNWGSVMGDPPAAYRYTHFALSKFGYDVMCEELNKSENITDWVETYKRQGEFEPEYLPAKLPILLLNGAFGIGVGMLVRVPSHNLAEVVEVMRGLLRDPNYKFTLIPDLCQPCDIIGDKKTWKEINETGTGSFKMRGHIVTEQDNKGNYRLRIVSLPQDVDTTMVYDKICALIEAKQLPMIKDIFNSIEEGTRLPNIIIDLKPGSDPEYVKQAIYSKTPVMKTFNVNFEAVGMNGIDIKRFNYREYLLAFIDMRMTTKFRLYCNMLQKAMTRHHRIDAYIKVMQSGEIDNIINMIKKAKQKDETPIIEYIIKHCGTTDIQAKFIIDFNLSKLTKAHLQEYVEERKELEQKIKLYEAKVTDDGTLIKEEIDQELVELAKTYSGKRLCNIINSDVNDNIPSGTFKVVITEKNYLRKLVDSDKVNIIKKDNPKFMLRVDNRENLLLFDNKGKVFCMPTHKIPVCDKQSPGCDARLLIRNLTADIVSVIPQNTLEKITSDKKYKYYLTILTKSNLIKKLDLEDFLNVNQSGLLYTKLRDDQDEVVSVKLIPAGLDVVVSAGKKVLRFPMKDIPLMKRSTYGVKAINTEDDVTSLVELFDQSTDIVVVTRNGKFNRFNSVMLQSHARISKGAGVIKLDPNDSIFSILGCKENDKIRIVTTEGIRDINVSEIKLKSPIAAGQKLIPANEHIIRAEVLY